MGFSQREEREKVKGCRGTLVTGIFCERVLRYVVSVEDPLGFNSLKG